MTLPLVRQQPWYPGQMGVPGSDVPRGLRWGSAGIVLFVDANHPNATTTADGTDPEYPLSTIAAAMARLVTFHAEASIQAEGSVIVVAPGIYTDNVVIANATYPEDCTILGLSSNRFGVIWRPASGDALTIDQGGWCVDNIHFQPADDGAGVKLTWDAGSGGEDALIQNCFFDGRWATGLYGIEFEGAPANVTIRNCRFAEFPANSPCITVTSTAVADVYQMHVLGCTFQECDEYISREVAGGYSQSIIMGNVFVDASNDATYPGGADGTDVFIDMRGATNGYNTVTMNSLGGDYSNTGGYFAGTGDNWIGNFAEDIAEAEVGAEGITIAVPAA